MCYVKYASGNDGKILVSAKDIADLFNKLMECEVASVTRIDGYVGMEQPAYDPDDYACAACGGNHMLCTNLR